MHYQPNDNGPNCCLRACYNNAKDEWIEQFGTTRFTVPHFNAVFVRAWNQFTLKAPPIVKKAFLKTGIFPLRPPSKLIASDVISGACTAAMQCSEGKKQVELDVMARSALAPVQFTTKTLTEPLTTIKAVSELHFNFSTKVFSVHPKRLNGFSRNMLLPKESKSEVSLL